MEQPNIFTESKPQLIPILPTLRQITHRKLAQYCHHNKGNDLYFFYEALNLLRAVAGEQVLINHYGDRYETIRKQLIVHGAMISRIKFYYDEIREKDDETKAEYRKIMEKYPMIQQTLYEVFVVLLNSTKLKYLAIPADAFRRELTKEWRPRHLPRRPPEDEVVEREED